ncbi:MAG TPA: DUF1269 domain-containing protein [Amnibacterium sp.]|uniref:DUF1269 domain-containing protein n=1 Tax=Amnibacterium sp. TaxID=1872496 RepID=UPI002F92B987
MPELIVLAFDEQDRAGQAYAKVQRLSDDGVVDLAGLALVRVGDRGRMRVDAPGGVGKAQLAAVRGGFFGLLIGLLLRSPVFGLALGAVLGVVLSRRDPSGLDERFRNRVRELAGAGRSAVVVYATRVEQPRFLQELEPFGGTLPAGAESEADEPELVRALMGGS